MSCHFFFAVNIKTIIFFSGIKRPGGLGSVLDKINKKQKISTLVSILYIYQF